MSDDRRLTTDDRRPTAGLSRAEETDDRRPAHGYEPSSTVHRLSSIELHIGELILHGFAPGDRYQIGEALERELARLIEEGGVPPALARGGAIARLDGGAFQVAAGATAEAIGAQVARAVYRGLTK